MGVQLKGAFLLVARLAQANLRNAHRSAEPVGRVMLLEAAHTSDPSLDPAMVLLKSIVQVDIRPVAPRRPRR